MFLSMVCFGVMFVAQGLFAAWVLEQFGVFDARRKGGYITAAEERQQGILAAMIDPVADIMLREDEEGIRFLLTVSVVLSGVIAIIFTNGDGCIVSVCVFLLAVIWLTLGNYSFFRGLGG